MRESITVAFPLPRGNCSGSGRWRGLVAILPCIIRQPQEPITMTIRRALCASVLIFALLLILSPLRSEEPGDLKGLGPIKQLHTGFAFTEGPAADKDGNVYF